MSSKSRLAELPRTNLPMVKNFRQRIKALQSMKKSFRRLPTASFITNRSSSVLSKRRASRNQMESVFKLREDKSMDSEILNNEEPSNKNLLSYSDFSQLLQVQIQSNSPYAYLLKPPIAQFQLANKRPERKSVKECFCSGNINNKRIRILKMWTQNIDFVAEQLPTYRRVFFNSVTDQKLLIFNVEGVILERTYSDKSRFLIRTHIAKVLLKLQKKFRLVLVYSQGNRGFPYLLNYLRREKVVVSGVYEVNDYQSKCKEILDFSNIYKDFNVHFPCSDVLILSSHNVLNEEIDPEQDMISYKKGMSYKLLVERVPVSLRDNVSCPIILVIPRLGSGETSISAVSILKLLGSVKSFSNLLLSDSLKVVTSSDVAVSAIEKSVHFPANGMDSLEEKLCKMHLIPRSGPLNLSVNHFAIMKLSSFALCKPTHFVLSV